MCVVMPGSIEGLADGAAAGWQEDMMSGDTYLKMIEKAVNAQARATQLETQLAGAASVVVTLTKERNTAWAELREIRRLIEADKDESTIDEVTRKLYRLSKDVHDAEQERDEARRELRELRLSIIETGTT